ncbi:tetratricopeptide repeat protein [candidate division KSB1 bacterium]|nr:tetratricopeptide repeat protein [candidate division KSB1 bacterium]
MRRKYSTGLALVILLGFTSIFAQNTQEQYNAKVQELNSVRAQMGATGITKDEYEKLKVQFDQLQKEIQTLETSLKADAEFSKKINDAKLAYNDGNNDYKKGDYEAAVVNYNKSIELNASDANVYRGKGLALLKLRKFDEAVEVFQKAVEIDPSNADAYSALGSALNLQKDYTKAIEAYEKSIELDQTKYKTIYNLGLVYTKVKDNKNAIKYFRMATQVNPEYYTAFNSLGVALVNDDQLDQAIMAFDQAIAVKDDYDEAYFRKAAAYNKLGEYGEALAAAQKCLESTRKFKGAANYEAGVASKALGQLSEAKNYFEAASTDRQWRKSAEYELELLEKGL